MEFVTNSPEETMTLGQEIGRLLGPGEVVALFGSLGSGKTTLVKGIALAQGVDPKVVRSASFVLMQEYQGKLPIYHFDAYRLEDPRDMFGLGCDEIFWGEGISIVEWADKVEKTLPEEYIKISLFIEAPNKRRIEISYQGERYKRIVQGLM
ncbi:MAG TPA: tRNA (adenosine(37)-N6)-threonylcarbamoyltransferase complex ATPase subunit type 1 TsaE, partial [Candidatus Hypogeohydataceae bacterium YC41]